MFPMIVLVPLFAFVGVKRITEQEQQRRAAAGDSNAVAVQPPSLVGMLLTMDLLVVFYLFVVHVPPGHFLEKQLPLTLLFVTTTIGVLGANTLQEKKGRPRLALFGKRLKVALIAPAVLFSLWSLRGVGLRAVFEEAGLAFFFFAGFMSMTALSIYRVQRRVGTESHSATVGVALIACSFGAVSYFLGVLAFSVGLYPFIPVARGGGDYSETGFVPLRMSLARRTPATRRSGGVDRGHRSSRYDARPSRASCTRRKKSSVRLNQRNRRQSSHHHPAVRSVGGNDHGRLEREASRCRWRGAYAHASALGSAIRRAPDIDTVSATLRGTLRFPSEPEATANRARLGLLGSPLGGSTVGAGLKRRDLRSGNSDRYSRNGALAGS